MSISFRVITRSIPVIEAEVEPTDLKPFRPELIVGFFAPGAQMQNHIVHRLDGGIGAGRADPHTVAKHAAAVTENTRDVVHGIDNGIASRYLDQPRPVLEAIASAKLGVRNMARTNRRRRE